MDYPFVKQVSGNYRAHISSLTRRDSEKQILANTVRILLLEEQNTELREKTATIILHTQQASEGHPYQVGYWHYDWNLVYSDNNGIDYCTIVYIFKINCQVSSLCYIVL